MGGGGLQQKHAAPKMENLSKTWSQLSGVIAVCKPKAKKCDSDLIQPTSSMYCKDYSSYCREGGREGGREGWQSLKACTGHQGPSKEDWRTFKKRSQVTHNHTTHNAKTTGRKTQYEGRVCTNRGRGTMQSLLLLQLTGLENQVVLTTQLSFQKKATFFHDTTRKVPRCLQ